MTRLETVTLRGTYRDLKAHVRFVRRFGGEWELHVKLGPKKTMTVLSKTAKPCWTLACDFMAQLHPANPRQSRSRERDLAKREQILRIVG